MCRYRGERMCHRKYRTCIAVVRIVTVIGYQRKYERGGCLYRSTCVAVVRIVTVIGYQRKEKEGEKGVYIMYRVCIVHVLQSFEPLFGQRAIVGYAYG